MVVKNKKRLHNPFIELVPILLTCRSKLLTLDLAVFLTQIQLSPIRGIQLRQHEALLQTRMIRVTSGHLSYLPQ